MQTNNQTNKQQHLLKGKTIIQILKKYTDKQLLKPYSLQFQVPGFGLALKYKTNV